MCDDRVTSPGTGSRPHGGRVPGAPGGWFEAPRGRVLRGRDFMSAWALTIMKVIFNFVWVAVLVAALPASAQDVGEPPASTEPGAVTDDEGEGDSGTAADEDGAHDDPSDESAVDEGAADHIFVAAWRHRLTSSS